MKKTDIMKQVKEKLNSSSTQTSAKKTRKKRISKKAKIKKIPRTKKPKKIKLKIETTKDRYGTKTLKYVDIPEELLITKDHINKYLECADYKEKRYFKLKELNKEKGYVSVITEQGAAKTLNLQSVCLHRNINVRNQNLDPNELLRAAKARRRGAKKK